MKNDINALNTLLEKGQIETQEEFNLYMHFHDEAFFEVPTNDEFRIFIIHLQNGYCSIAVAKSDIKSIDVLIFNKYIWSGEPIPIHFYDYRDIQFPDYDELLWKDIVDQSIIFNYRLVGNVCRVFELQRLTADVDCLCNPDYFRIFLKSKKMIINTFALNGVLKTLYCNFIILDDCNIEQDGWETLKNVHVQITSTQLV